MGGGGKISVGSVRWEAWSEAFLIGPGAVAQIKGFSAGASSAIRKLMQTIFQTSLTPEQYAEQDYQRQVKSPENCPNCSQALTLEALGYYHRYITTATALVLWIWIRRFLCRHCRISVSCLPQFAQPYRPVNTPTIAAGVQRPSHAAGSALERTHRRLLAAI